LRRIGVEGQGSAIGYSALSPEVGHSCLLLSAWTIGLCCFALRSAALQRKGARKWLFKSKWKLSLIQALWTAERSGEFCPIPLMARYFYTVQKANDDLYCHTLESEFNY